MRFGGEFRYELQHGSPFVFVHPESGNIVIGVQGHNGDDAPVRILKNARNKIKVFKRIDSAVKEIRNHGYDGPITLETTSKK